MKRFVKNRIMVFIIGALALVIVASMSHIHQLNQYYQSHFGRKDSIYEPEQWVQLGNNIVFIDTAPGYEVCLVSAEIYEFEDAIEKWASQIDGRSVSDQPERVMDVILKVRNVDSNAAGIYLLDFQLHTICMPTDMNIPLTTAVNGLPEDSLGIALPQGTEYTVHLIYNVREQHFFDCWEALDREKFYIQVTDSPVHQEIQFMPIS